MASIEAISRFITTLRVHLNVPIALSDPERGAKEQAWAVSIGGCIKGYSDDVVTRAADRLLARRTRSDDRRFPLPGEIAKVCEELVADDDRKRLPLGSENTAAPGGAYRTRLAYDLMRGPMGRRAVKEGWVGPLFWWIAEHGKLPSETAKTSLKTLERNADGGLVWRTITAIEVDHLRMQAQGFDDAYAQCLRGGWAFAKMFVAMGEKQEILGEVLADHVAGEIDLREVTAFDQIEDRMKARAQNRDRQKQDQAGSAAMAARGEELAKRVLGGAG